MSRCFPFPPPGYEKKARIEDLHLPKKDKHKKRKKEKRDQKEKRKSSNRDERDKEKDRVKDKAITLDEAKLPDKTNGHTHSRQFLIRKDQKDENNCCSTEKKYAEQSARYTEGESKYSSHLPEQSRAFKIVPELGRSNKEGDGGCRNLLGEKFSVCLPQRDDWVGSRTVARVTQSFVEGKTKDENKENDASGDREIRKESKFGSRATIEATVIDRVDSVGADTRTEGKRWKGNGRDEKRNQKQKDKDKQEGNGKEKNKKRKEKIELKIGNLEKSKESNEDDATSTDSIITSQILRDSHKPVARMGSVMKRKNFETNGILHAKDHTSSNSAKFTSSSDLHRENCKMLKPCQSSAVAASNWQVHSKPPHPDLEYLSQLYLVPKMEDWSDFCDQDWLFSSNASQSQLKKLRAHSLELEVTTPHVWAEAMQIEIESIDIFALPYVVPY